MYSQWNSRDVEAATDDDRVKGLPRSVSAVSPAWTVDSELSYEGDDSVTEHSQQQQHKQQQQKEQLESLRCASSQRTRLLLCHLSLLALSLTWFSVWHCSFVEVASEEKDGMVFLGLWTVQPNDSSDLSNNNAMQTSCVSWQHAPPSLEDLLVADVWVSIARACTLIAAIGGTMAVIAFYCLTIGSGGGDSSCCCRRKATHEAETRVRWFDTLWIVMLALSCSNTFGMLELGAHPCYLYGSCILGLAGYMSIAASLSWLIAALFLCQYSRNADRCLQQVGTTTFPEAAARRASTHNSRNHNSKQSTSSSSADKQSHPNSFRA